MAVLPVLGVLLTELDGAIDEAIVLHHRREGLRQ
jgi:hypothetical protein